MQKILIFIIVCLSFQMNGQGELTKSKTNINRNLDSLFQYCHNNNLFNGSVLVYQNEEIYYSKSFGKLSLDSGLDITKDTPFLLASLSKQMTAMGIMKLQEEGKLQFEDLVKKFIPDFPYSEITIRHFLNHTSGLPEYMDLINPKVEDFIRMHEMEGFVLTNNDIVQKINKNKPTLNFQAGSNFDYSNTGYIYLASIIEIVSEKSFEHYMNQEFFIPLKMKNSWVIGGEKADKSHKAIGYRNEEKNEVPEFLGLVGDGGIYSSTRDLQTWFSALDNGRIISKNKLKEAYRVPRIEGKNPPYGFGWFVKKLPNGRKALTHSGQFFGFTNSIFRDLDDKTTAIILSNNSHEVNAEINGALMRIIYDVPFDLPKINVETAIGNILYLSGIQAVKEFYDSHEDNQKYDFSEKAINSYGYDLLSSENVDQAIELFKWNVELYPNSSNVYDSLGEAYLVNKNEKQALVNYQKAFELDPSNKNAEKIIKKLKEKLN